ncbi:MAG: hemerythrin domain-containing protein [Myxococcota bacterium]
MRLIDDMQAEHVLIGHVLGSLRTYVHARATLASDSESTAAPIADAEAFGRFFHLYAGAYHHAREEDVLFAALVREAGLPRERGPLFAIEKQHHAMATTLDRLLTLLGGSLSDTADRAQAQSLAIAYSHALWRHIDAENSVLFPESVERLLRVGVTELPGRSTTPEEDHARREGEALVQRYVPFDDPSAGRGEGCPSCPSFGVDCDGVEREWWSDSEWDELDDRVGH